MNVEINPIAERQILRVLSLMGPYSVSKFLEAVQEGMVDGRFYNEVVGLDEDGDEIRGHRPYNETEYIYTDEQDGPIPFGEFRGCLLGWAGFLEHQHYAQFRQNLVNKFGTRLSVTPRLSSDSDTREAEEFLRYIHLDDTPEDDDYSAALEQLILDFQSGKKAAVPVQEDERYDYVADGEAV